MTLERRIFDSPNAAPSGAAGGDLSGTFPNPTVATVGGKTAALALVPTAVQSSAYSAVAGDFVPVDASGGTVTVTLPTAPADKTRVGVKIVAQAGTPNAVTISRGGSDVFNKTGGSTSLTLTALFQGLILQYTASSGIWYVQSLDAATGNAGGAASLGTDGKHKASEIPLTVVNGSSDTLIDAKGDLLAGTADNVRARLGVGIDGQVLTADAASTPGVKWAANSLARTGVKVIASFNGATDGTVINAALTALSGPGAVLLPVGTGVIDTTILLGPGQWLIGAGWGTVLQAANGLNAAVIANSTANSVGLGVTKLVVDGNRANNASGAGISFNWNGNTISSVSPYFMGAILEDLYIRFCAGDGYTGVNATNGMGIEATNLTADRCNGNGFTIQHTETMLTNLYAEKSGLAGFVIGPNGASVRLTNCFGDDSGQVTAASGHGFIVNSGYCTFVSCGAQDNSMHGYYVTTAGGLRTSFSGCIADSNSFGNGSANAAGFYIDTATAHTSISGCQAIDRFAGGSRTQAYGYYIAGTADYVRISSIADNNVTADFFNNSSGTHNEIATKTVTVNAQSGTTYTFANGDIGLVVESTGAGAATFTIPTAAAGLIPVGAMIEVFQYGAGQVTIAAAGGVTLRSDGAKVKTAAQYATIALRQRASDEWVLSGDLS